MEGKYFKYKLTQFSNSVTKLRTINHIAKFFVIIQLLKVGKVIIQDEKKVSPKVTRKNH